MALGQVGRMGGNPVGDDSGLDVFLVGQSQVFLGSHVTQHGTTKPANHGGSDG